VLLPPDYATLRIPCATSSCMSRSAVEGEILFMTRLHPIFASYFDANNRFIHVILAFYQQKLKTNLTNYPLFHKQFRLKRIWEISHILFTSSYFSLTSPQTLIHGYFSLLFCLSDRHNKKEC
jgi:hypothetical protein